MSDLLLFDDLPQVAPVIVLSPGQPKPKKRGYAWTPGTGPVGETCKTCNNCYRKQMAGVFYKCLLTKAKWTGGQATDILIRSPACKFWEPRHEVPTDDR